MTGQTAAMSAWPTHDKKGSRHSGPATMHLAKCGCGQPSPTHERQPPKSAHGVAMATNSQATAAHVATALTEPNCQTVTCTNFKASQELLSKLTQAQPILRA
jgi:hypothetical protein